MKRLLLDVYTACYYQKYGLITNNNMNIKLFGEPYFKTLECKKVQLKIALLDFKMELISFVIH